MVVGTLFVLRSLLVPTNFPTLSFLRVPHRLTKQPPSFQKEKGFRWKFPLSPMSSLVMSGPVGESIYTQRFVEAQELGPLLETPDNFPCPVSTFSSSFIYQLMAIIGANLTLSFRKL